MYRGFDLSIKDIDIEGVLKNETTKKAQENFVNNEKVVRTELKKYLLPNGNIDGKKLQDEWFPQLKSDVFISHSHDDLDTALFVGGIFESFGLKVFIDSTVWGYADELLKLIDDSMCISTRDPKSYDYQSRNYSTAHVHMMLSVALNKMIDKSECLLFLNTPNSISTNNVITQRTKSPWIYSEIANSRLFRIRKPTRMIKKSFSKEGGKVELGMITERIEHSLELDHLQKIDESDILKWLDLINDKDHVLDTLYEYVDQQH